MSTPTTRLTARTRSPQEGLPPEVRDAIGHVEATLGDVARWEQLLAGRPADGPMEAPAEAPVLVDPGDGSTPAGPGHPVPAHHDADPAGHDPAGADAESPASRADDTVAVAPVPIVAPEAEAEVTELRVELPSRPDEPADGAAGDEADAAILAAGGSLLWQARTVEDGGPAPVATAAAADAVEDDVRARRRNGRLLSWAGVVVLVAGAALWLIPDRSSDPDGGELPALESRQSTTTAPEFAVPDVLPDPEVTAPSTTPSTDTTAPADADTTPTTRRPTTTTTARRATTPPPAPATTTTSPVVNPPLLPPNTNKPPVDPTRPNTTTTVATTTTQPATTTTQGE